MQRNIILTKDGSHTIAIPGMNVTYHSMYGAIQESLHVFIEAGFYAPGRSNQPGTLCILEVGFGTGLNALLTLIEAGKTQRPVHYTALELFPLDEEQVRSLNYCEQLDRTDLQPVFERLHSCRWEREILFSNCFTLQKRQASLVTLSTTTCLPAGATLLNLIYFDAFAPGVQPELWTKEVFEKLYAMLLPGGMLVTYCSKGDVRRAMQAAGFSTQKIPGPPGKREMLRAIRIS